METARIASDFLFFSFNSTQKQKKSPTSILTSASKRLKTEGNRVIFAVCSISRTFVDSPTIAYSENCVHNIWRFVEKTLQGFQWRVGIKDILKKRAAPDRQAKRKIEILKACCVKKANRNMYIYSYFQKRQFAQAEIENISFLHLDMLRQTQ